MFEFLLNDKLDVVATDHASSYYRGKIKYLSQEAPSGGPLVQHALLFLLMLEFYKKGKISLEKIVEKMCHNPAYFISNC